MLNVKWGLNDYAVFVIERYSYEEPKIKCTWLGHHRFRCDHCRKGYFNVYTENRHDEECPECKYRVVIRWQG